MLNKCVFYQILIVTSITIISIDCLPDEGKWDFNLTKDDNYFYLSKSLYKSAQVFIQVNCETQEETNIKINLVILPSLCWQYEDALNQAKEIIKSDKNYGNGTIHHLTSAYKCDEHIQLASAILKKDEKSLHTYSLPNYIIPHDGVYVLVFEVTPNIDVDFIVGIHIQMRSSYGYLSAADWPLLPFYGFMCIFYIILGIIWLILSFLQWRDLLRVQFWIGGVILLGMLEKATFYAEYQSINTTGVRVQGAMLFAEWVSCAKRTLARMLVIIVSLGFGIVKPRLGSTLHRVVGVGFLYFILAASEAYMRIIRPKNDQGRDLLVASVPLAVLDSAICWWIFSALVNTTRTLRLRRNEVKLSLYRHFTNTLIFSVIASICFMLYSIKTHHLVNCLVIWKDIWLEDAYWHILFSALLLVIMILWRPTNNNQRYAFVPLLDTGDDDDDDDEEEEQLVNDAYGVKVRINHHHHHKQQTSNKQQSPRNTVDDDLKWLEENVKSEPALPILDSDEELVNTRFEVSKMQ